MCHIVSFIGHLRSGRLEVTFCSLVVNFHLGGHVCFGSVTLDLRKIPQSGDMSHRGFIRIVQTFELFGLLRIGKLEVLVFFFALFGECDIGFKNNLTQWNYVT